jgi:hypothetical protein
LREIKEDGILFKMDQVIPFEAISKEKNLWEGGQQIMMDIMIKNYFKRT